MKSQGRFKRALWLGFQLWVGLLYASIWAVNFANINSPVPPAGPWWKLLAESFLDLIVYMTVGLPMSIWPLILLLPVAYVLVWASDRIRQRGAEAGSPNPGHDAGMQGQP